MAGFTSGPATFTPTSLNMVNEAWRMTVVIKLHPVPRATYWERPTSPKIAIYDMIMIISSGFGVRKKYIYSSLTAAKHGRKCKE